MFRILKLFILLLFVNIASYGQLVVDGAVFTVQKDAVLAVEKNINIQSNGIIHNAGSIYLKGDWNNFSGAGALIPDSGKVIMNGLNQIIQGDYTTDFNNLDLVNGNKILKGMNKGFLAFRINNQLALNNSSLDLNSRKLEILNSSTQAIISTNGAIISESIDSVPNKNYSNLIWYISNNIGLYTVPFSTSNGVSIPLSINITSAGNSGGYFTFSTYPTNFRNTPFASSPSISNMNIDNYNDMSLDAVNRFWRVLPSSYSLIPSYKIGFSYDPANDLCADSLCISLLNESNLVAVNWNDANNNWQLPYVGGVCDSINNQYITDPIQTDNSWWTLSKNTSYPYPNQEICLVTIDSTGNNNLVVWEKDVNVGIAKFNIYKESTVSGVYSFLGDVSIDSLSVFYDTTANPSSHRDKYRITVVDTLSVESQPSADHTTMHLSITAGVGGKWNLFWTPYIGFNVSTYKIWRGVTPTSMTLIDSVSGNTLNYTDNNPPVGALHYMIEVVKPGTPCLPTKANTNYNTSRSNAANNGITQTLIASFSANPALGSIPLTVNFTNSSFGSDSVFYWDFGDGNFSTQENPVHIYNSVGLYTVKLKICNDILCDSLSKIGYISVLPDGLEELGMKISVKLYPNSNNGVFNLDINSINTEVLHLNIFNQTGQQVYTDEFTVNGNLVKTINLRALAKGLYYVSLSSKDKIVYKGKVVIN